MYSWLFVIPNLEKKLKWQFALKSLIDKTFQNEIDKTCLILEGEMVLDVPFFLMHFIFDEGFFSVFTHWFNSNKMELWNFHSIIYLLHILKPNWSSVVWCCWWSVGCKLDWIKGNPMHLRLTLTLSLFLKPWLLDDMPFS